MKWFKKLVFLALCFVLLCGYSNVYADEELTQEEINEQTEELISENAIDVDYADDDFTYDDLIEEEQEDGSVQTSNYDEIIQIEDSCEMIDCPDGTCTFEVVDKSALDVGATSIGTLAEGYEYVITVVYVQDNNGAGQPLIRLTNTNTGHSRIVYCTDQAYSYTTTAGTSDRTYHATGTFIANYSGSYTVEVFMGSTSHSISSAGFGRTFTEEHSNSLLKSIYSMFYVDDTSPGWYLYAMNGRIKDLSETIVPGISSKLDNVSARLNTLVASGTTSGYFNLYSLYDGLKNLWVVDSNNTAPGWYLYNMNDRIKVLVSGSSQDGYINLYTLNATLTNIGNNMSTGFQGISKKLDTINETLQNLEITSDLGTSDSGSNIWDFLTALVNKLGDIITALANLVDDLINDLTDLIKSLFIPDSETLQNWVDTQKDTLNNSTGLVGSVNDMMDIFLEAFNQCIVKTRASGQSIDVYVPAVSIMGVQFFGIGETVDLSAFSDVHDYYFIVFKGIASFMFLDYLRRKFNWWFGSEVMSSAD